MKTDSPYPFVSVYVPDYPASSPLSAQRRHQSSPGIGLKARARSLRRCLNRLSRLQKSFLLMILMVFIIFSLILTTITWVPQMSSSGIDNSLNSLFNGAGPDGNMNLRAEELYAIRTSKPPVVDNQLGVGQLENIHQPVLIKTTVKPKRPDNVWDMGLSKSPSVAPVIPTIPKGLQPDFSDNVRAVTTWDTKPAGLIKGLIGEKAAEDIRKVISQDQVIPLRPRPKESTKGPSVIDQPRKGHESRLKFHGPENTRQKAVVDAFMHAWKGYKKYAWGRDHLRPISGTGQDWFGLGLTLIDSLDTMYIMGLEHEYFEARDWVEDSLSFDDVSRNVNLFETTIRVLGGLLSTYHLTQEKIFLTKAQELGSILSVGFKSPSGVPYSDINLKAKSAHGPAWNPDSTTSEVTTLQLEFRDLSRATNVPLYEGLAMNVSIHVHNQWKMDGLVPIHISPVTGEFRHTSVITLGARGDSYYEYLLKQWIQTGKKIDFLRDDYLTAVEGMRKHLLKRTAHSNLTYLGELEQNGKLFRPKMDHLVCYLSGTLALGWSHGLPDWHLDLAKSLMRTCYQTYKEHPTGLAPEITYFRMEDDKTSDFYVKSNDAHNLLRPETVESLFYLYQITGDKQYQHWGWEIFESFMKHTRVEYGFTSINNVLDPDDLKPRDMLESFFLAETLKYFYLLFSNNVVFDLKEWLFNTEAHLLPVYDH